MTRCHPWGPVVCGRFLLTKSEPSFCVWSCNSCPFGKTSFIKAYRRPLSGSCMVHKAVGTTNQPIHSWESCLAQAHNLASLSKPNSTPFPADLHHKNAKLYYSKILAQEGLQIPCILKNEERRVKSRVRAFLRKRKQFSPKRYLDTLHVLSAFQQTAATLLTALLGHCGEWTALGHTAAGSQSFSESDANRVQLE